MSETFSNIWDALIDDDPVEKESCKIKSQLMMAVELFIIENKLTQQAAADLMGTTQPKVSNIVNGNIDKISIDLLVNMLAKVGENVVVSVGPKKTKQEKVVQSFSQSFSAGEFCFSDDYYQHEAPYTLNDKDWLAANASRGGSNEIAATG